MPHIRTIKKASRAERMEWEKGWRIVGISKSLKNAEVVPVETNNWWDTYFYAFNSILYEIQLGSALGEVSVGSDSCAVPYKK